MGIQMAGGVPDHICVVMDGNRRWAKDRKLPVALGHAAGAKQVKTLVTACASREIPFVTVFAFSTENWKRPEEEVGSLVGLLTLYLGNEVRSMQAQGVRLKIVGDLSRFDSRMRDLVEQAHEMTASNTRITLSVAINYGGRWDMLQATKAWHKAHPGRQLSELNEAGLEPYLATSHAPHPDLMIRTGGEFRISNFMLWQLAYTELYITDVLWPSFDEAELDKALEFYKTRDRRFGGSSTRHIFAE